MRLCSICHEWYSHQTFEEPAELCACGEMATGSPWAWDHWRGVRNAVLYWLARQCYALGNYIVMRGYR